MQLQNYSIKTTCNGFAGAEGKVEESIALMKEVEDLKAKKRTAEVQYEKLWLIYTVSRPGFSRSSMWSHNVIKIILKRYNVVILIFNLFVVFVWTLWRGYVGYQVKPIWYDLLISPVFCSICLLLFTYVSGCISRESPIIISPAAKAESLWSVCCLSQLVWQWSQVNNSSISSFILNMLTRNFYWLGPYTNRLPFLSLSDIVTVHSFDCYTTSLMFALSQF